MGESWCLVFLCISLIISELKHLFIFFLVICISPSSRNLPIELAYFFDWAVCLFPTDLCNLLISNNTLFLFQIFFYLLLLSFNFDYTFFCHTAAFNFYVLKFISLFFLSFWVFSFLGSCPQKYKNTWFSPRAFVTLVFHNYIFYPFYIFMAMSFNYCKVHIWLNFFPNGWLFATTQFSEYLILRPLIRIVIFNIGYKKYVSRVRLLDFNGGFAT